MAIPECILSNYITHLTNVEDINKHLFQQYNILSRVYPEYNLTIYYNKFDSRHTSIMEMYCRSIVLSNEELGKIVCYTCPTPIYNLDAIQYMWKNQDKPKNIYTCYEGSLMSLFYHNNKWFLSTRKQLFTNTSELTGHFKMFMDVLNKDGYDTLDKFTEFLNKDYIYFFVLIHYENKNIVNYTLQFGENYTKLCFIFGRDKNMIEIKSEDIENTFLSDNIFLPKIIKEEHFSQYMNELSIVDVSKKPENEGIIIKMENVLLKLQSSAYQFYKSIGSEKNMFKGFINLYQLNSLKGFLMNPNNNKYQKIVNPMNTNESFDTIGMIDAMFKVITTELYNLFYLLWNDNNERLNPELYNYLPREYKDMMYYVRGIYFNNKKYYNGNGTVINSKDIYNLLKTKDTNILEKFIRSRKLMLNWTRLDKTNVKFTSLFNKTLHSCEKVYYKMTAIYTSKLFPEIMPDDLPTFGSS